MAKAKAKRTTGRTRSARRSNARAKRFRLVRTKMAFSHIKISNRNSGGPNQCQAKARLKSPFPIAQKEWVKPHPGQGKPVTFLKAQMDEYSAVGVVSAGW